MAVQEKSGKKVAASKPSRQEEGISLSLSFENNALLGALYGEQDENLAKLERAFGITAVSRGNLLVLEGARDAVRLAKDVLETLYLRLKNGDDIKPSDVDASLRMFGDMLEDGKAESRAHKLDNIKSSLEIRTLKKVVKPYSHSQAEYIKQLYQHDLVFALGPAGTGKTYIAVAMAVHAFINKQVDRIILSRPAVEAGERLGFLPGDLKDKIDPYLRPLYDALYDMLPAEKVLHYLETGEIEVAPLAFMRGRTLGNAYIILDEAQNTTPTQMKMFLTRLGENSRMVITGDLSQCDLPRDIASGLRDAITKLEDVEGIGITRFSEKDVVRHALAARIVQAYERWDQRKDKKG